MFHHNHVTKTEDAPMNWHIKKKISFWDTELCDNCSSNVLNKIESKTILIKPKYFQCPIEIV